MKSRRFQSPLTTRDRRFDEWTRSPKDSHGAPVEVHTPQSRGCVNGYATAVEAAEAARILLDRKFWSNADRDEFYEDEDGGSALDVAAAVHDNPNNNDAAAAAATAATTRKTKTPKPRRPLFLYLAWHAPHAPYQHTPWADRYKDKYPSVNGEVRFRMGMVSALDHYVKEVLAALHKRRALHSTLIVFASDNGAPGSAYIPREHHQDYPRAQPLRRLQEYEYEYEQEANEMIPQRRHSHALMKASERKKRNHSENKSRTDSSRGVKKRGGHWDSDPSFWHRSMGGGAVPTRRPLSPYDFYPTNAPLWGFKGSLFEGSIRTFAFALWPGVLPPGTVVRAPMHIADWFPTFFAIAGLPSAATTRVPWERGAGVHRNNNGPSTLFLLEEKKEEEWANNSSTSHHGAPQQPLDGIDSWRTIRGHCEGENLRMESSSPSSPSSRVQGCRDRSIFISSLIPSDETPSFDGSNGKGMLGLTRGALIARNGKTKFLIEMDAPTAWCTRDVTQKDGKSTSGRLIKTKCEALRKSPSEWRSEVPLKWLKWHELKSLEKDHPEADPAGFEVEVDVTSHAQFCLTRRKIAALLSPLRNGETAHDRGETVRRATMLLRVRMQNLTSCPQQMELLVGFLAFEDDQKMDFKELIARQVVPNSVATLKEASHLSSLVRINEYAK